MGVTRWQRQEQRHQEDLQRLQGFRPIDDTFMRGLFKENIPLAEFVLRIITGKQDLILTKCETQADFKRVTGARSICLDVSAKYSCGFPNTLVSSIIVGERYLDYFTTITEDRLWQLLAKSVFRWRNRSGLSMNAAKAA